MELTAIEYRFQSYKTTNPPLSESAELSVRKTAAPFSPPRFSLHMHESRNAESVRGDFPLTQAQFEETVELFCSLQLKEAVLAALEAPQAPPTPSPMGGSFSEALSFTANGVTVTAQSLPANAGALVRRLRELRQEVGGEAQLPPGPFAAAPCPVPTAAPAAQHSPASLPADAWFCPLCGMPNTGRFCSECGSERT